MPIMKRATASATPEFTIALLIAKAQAIVIRISQDIYLVYLRAGNIFVQAIMIVVMETKKNISNLISGKASLTTGSSPTVAPTIINISKTKANQRFPFPGTGSVSLPLASNTNTEDSPRSLQKSHQPSPPAYPLRGDIHFPDFRQCSDRYA